MKEKLLLTYYLQQNRLIKLTEIARDFRISQRKAHMLIQDFNYFSPKTGCVLEARTNLGYELIVQDAPKMADFIKETASSVAYLNPNHRRLLTQIYLVSQNSYVSTSQLSDFLGASRSTITADLKALEPKMAAFQLEISAKTYYGLTVRGSELNKRLCLIKALNLLPVMTLQEEFVNYRVAADFQQEVRELFGKHQVNLTESVFLTIVQYMVVMINRLGNGEVLAYSTELKREQLTSLQEPLKALLEKWYQIPLPKGEVSYLIDYIGDQLITYQVEDREYERFTSRFLEKLTQKAGLPLMPDESLLQKLSKHLLNLSKRLTYGTQILFPQRKEYYQGNFFEIYLTQVFLAELSSEVPLKNITIDEVLYVSLYFKAWLLQSGENFDIYRKKVVVMTESRSGSYLLKAQLKEHYPSMSVTIFDEIDLLTIRKQIKNYDLVMTSKTLNQELQYEYPSVLQIKDYLSTKEQQLIEKRIKELFEWPAVAELLHSSNYQWDQVKNNQDWQEQGSLLIVEGLFACQLRIVKEISNSQLVIKQFSQPIIISDKKVFVLLSLSYEKSQLKVVKNLCQALENLTKSSLLKGELLSCQSREVFIDILRRGYLGK